MSRDWDDDDDDRPRRRRRNRDDYDDIGRSRGNGSGSVISVGVITIILGSLMLLCGLCFAIGSIGFAGAGVGPNRNQFFPFQMAAGVLVVISIIILVLGTLYLIGGIGVLQRRNWGRIMTLVMAGFSALFGILTLIGGIINMAQPVPGDAKVIGLLINLITAIVFFTHCIMSFVILLSGDNAREFE